jgi:hypothetical protein
MFSLLAGTWHHFRSWSFMADETVKAALAKASSDLKFLMDEAGVSMQTQAKVSVTLWLKAVSAQTPWDWLT